MAQKVSIILIDDIDGNEAQETVTFGLDGVSYEIDLTTENAEKLRDALAPWVGHARKVARGGGRRRGAGAGTASGAGPTAAEMREWGRANGFEVSDRGRVPADLRAAYEKAH